MARTLVAVLAAWVAMARTVIVIAFLPEALCRPAVQERTQEACPVVTVAVAAVVVVEQCTAATRQTRQ